MTTARFHRAAGIAAALMLAAPGSAQSDDAKEAACLVKAQESAAPPGSASVTILSGDASRGRTFIRLSWAAPGLDDTRFKAFECYFERDALVNWGFAGNTIMGPRLGPRN